MTSINTLFLLAGLLLFISVLASTLSARLGVPLLLLFLLVGMLAGEDGPGGILFSDFVTAATVGQLALAVILLDGGLRTRKRSFRVALKPAAVLATFGVLATSGLLGVFATWLLDVDWRLGLLLAAIVGSTDAAAVFSLLRNCGVELNERVRTTLEIESGANDPMAILLVSVLVGALLQPEQAGWENFFRMLASQMGLGLLFGLAGGWAIARLLARLALADGLFALLVLSGGLLLFAAANSLDGSGFLAIYVAGVIVGNRRHRTTEAVLPVMDGLTWLAQVGLFVVLGLLVTPSHLLAYAWESLAMALFLMLVARPLAVWLSLLPFRYPGREVLFISWVGLRGGVPVVLAILPVVLGVPESKLLFDVAFAVVLLSLLLQGASIPPVARWLRVELPARPRPLDRRDLWVGEQLVLPLFEYRVAAGARAVGWATGQLAVELGLPVRCLAVLRAGQVLDLAREDRLQADDRVWLQAPEDEAEAIADCFAVPASVRPRQPRFYGEFALYPGVAAAALAGLYGFRLRPEEEGLPLQAVLTARLGRPAVVGDRVLIDGFSLVVREMDEAGNILQIGLKLPVRAIEGEGNRADI